MSEKFWTESRIATNILRIKEGLCIDRMPSNSEIKSFDGDNRLSNAIMKKGGFRYWAEKLGLDMKVTESEHGYKQERIICDLISKHGYEAEMTSIRFPYDVLVEGVVKVDVKCAHLSKVREYDAYSFRIAKDKPTCDLYFIACLNNDDTINMLYVIPAHKLVGQVQLVISGSRVSQKYAKYLNRWDLLDSYVSAFKKLS